MSSSLGMSSSLLKCVGVTVRYGNTPALTDVSLDLAPGEITAVVGANGAGKSTLLNTIVGITTPESGQIEFAGASIVGIDPWKACELGIVQVPEGRQVFAGLKVSENLKAAQRSRGSFGITFSESDVFDLFPRLAERRGQLAGNLSGGEQQMLAVGRALLCNPRLLLLDEPTLGLSPKLADDVLQRISTLQETGLTILLVEQNAVMALELAQRAYVFATGHVEMSGTASDLAGSPEIQRAYLGH